MLLMRASQILVSPGVSRLAALPVSILLGACGQKGPLFLPASDAGRATLTQTLTSPAAPASAPPVTGTASPVRTP
jgi:predicted small lipoprotein YifL